MEREDVLDIAIGVAGVGLFIFGLMFVGVLYGIEDGIKPDARLPLLGVITMFVLAMGVAGFWLAERD